MPPDLLTVLVPNYSYLPNAIAIAASVFCLLPFAVSEWLCSFASSAYPV
uniref:Uncharacterized protein n=1 Tax=Arundo donax TaxID=35708 RepID=A0A0A8ZPA8_ARUDO